MRKDDVDLDEGVVRLYPRRKRAKLLNLFSEVYFLKLLSIGI